MVTIKSDVDYYNQAIAYADQRKYKLAFRYFDKAFDYLEANKDARDPSDVSSYMSAAGMASHEVREYEKALYFLNRGIKLYPKDNNLYFQRGMLYECIGEYENAYRDLSHAIKLNPECEKCYYYRALLFARHLFLLDRKSLEFRQVKRAVKDFDKAIKLDLKDADAYFQKGQFLEALGDYHRAIASYNSAIRLEHKDANYYNKRGLAHLYHNSMSDSLRDFNRAIKLEPKNEIYYFNRATAYLYSGKFEHALADLRKVKSNEHKDEYYYRHKIEAYQSLGKMKEARETCKILLKIHGREVIHELGLDELC